MPNRDKPDPTRATSGEPSLLVQGAHGLGPISRRQTLILATGIFLLLWAVYLLVYSGTLLVIDEQHIFAVGESLALHGTVDANQVRFAPHILPASGKFGLNGDYHTTHGSALSFLAAPMIFLARMLPHVGAVQFSLLLNSLFTALTAVLVFSYVQNLLGSWHTGLAAALLFGLCTLALPYAKTLYIEPLSALTLFGAAWALLLYRDRGSLRLLALGGGLAGLAVVTKPTNGVALPAFLLYAAWVFLRNRSRTGRPTPREVVLASLAFGLPLAVWLAGLGVFNVVRFGDPLDVGHVAYSLQFNTPLWEGLYGLLASPGKGFFWYAPILLLWPFALPAFLRHHAAEALLCLAVSGAILVAHALYFMWYGGTCWGPRFVVPLMPFFLVGTVPTLSWLQRHWPGRSILALLVVLSAGVQFLGVAVKPNHYFSLLERQFPNAETNTALLFDPQYSPLLGHAALALNPHNYNFAWLRGVEGVLYVDWVPILLTVILAGLALAVLFCTRARVRSLALGVALVGAVVVPAVSLVRYYDDPRYGGGEVHWDLLRRLETSTASGHAVISHDAAHTNFYLNYSHVTVPWYGVPRESLPLSPETAGLMERLVRERSRLWVILPNTPPGDPASGVERWLAESIYPTTDEAFGQNLRLASFAVPRSTVWHDSEATLGDQAALGAVQLEAYGLPDRSVAPGDVLCLALRWRCLDTLPADYTVFVQLLGPDGLPASQSDRQPVAGFRPTSTWQPGEVVLDRHGVPLAPDLPPGEYHLIAGLYDPGTGARLSTPDGNFIDLGTVRIASLRET